jgi:hypothetical protein
MVPSGLEESGCCRSVQRQLLTILDLQKTNYPRYAASYFSFGQIQFHGNIAVIYAFTHQSIDRTQDPCLFPKAVHFMPPCCLDHGARESHQLRSLVAETGCYFCEQS